MHIMTESHCKNIFPLNWFLIKKRLFAVRMHTGRCFFYAMKQKPGNQGTRTKSWRVEIFQTKAHQAWTLGRIVTVTKAGTVKMHINIVYWHEKLRGTSNGL